MPQPTTGSGSPDSEAGSRESSAPFFNEVEVSLGPDPNGRACRTGGHASRSVAHAQAGITLHSFLADGLGCFRGVSTVLLSGPGSLSKQQPAQQSRLRGRGVFHPDDIVRAVRLTIAAPDAGVVDIHLAGLRPADCIGRAVLHAMR